MPRKAQTLGEATHTGLQRPVREQLGATITARGCAVQEAKVDNEVAPQDSRRIRVESLDSLVDQAGVKAAGVAEVTAGGIRGEGVDFTDVTTRGNGVRAKYDLYSSTCGWCRGAPEVVRELGVPEEESRVGHIEPGGFAFGDTPVDKERVRESRFSENSEESRGSDVERGVGCDRLLNALVAKLRSDGDIV